MERTRILSASEMEIKTERIALEILEDSHTEPILYLVGIMPNGKQFAEDLIRHIKKEIPTIECVLITASAAHKNSSDAEISFSMPLENIRNHHVVLIDDVLNSGKTMAAVLKEIVQQAPKQVKTAVMVERAHKNFPIHADYRGLSVNTNLQNHIEVEMQGEKSAWLL